MKMWITVDLNGEPHGVYDSEAAAREGTGPPTPDSTSWPILKVRGPARYHGELTWPEKRRPPLRLLREGETPFDVAE
jgi:hypothetical protein